MKKVLLLIFLFLLIPFKIYASEKLSDGWHVVKNVQKTDSCKLNNVWAYYKNGIEQSRYCRFIQIHRAWGEAPENSLAAIKMVKEKGYTNYETDVRFTKDNVAVLLHNPTINKMARNKDYTKLNKEIAVKNITFKELNKYIFVVTRKGKVLKGKEYQNNKITTFEEAVKYSKENGLYMTIELKDGISSQIASLVDIVKKYNMQNDVLYISFFPELLVYLKNKDPYAMMGLLDRSYYEEKGVCEPDYKTRYCKSITEKGKDEGAEQREYFYKLLRTGHNYVRISGGTSPDKLGYGIFTGKNLPDEIADYPSDKYKLSVIKPAELKLSSSSISITRDTTTEVSYTYNGDGEVKCVSSNKSIVTCSVNESKKTITLKGLKTANDIKITLYATQGTKYSATGDISLKTNILAPSREYVRGDVNGDNTVNMMDYQNLRNHILETFSPKGDKTKLLTGDALKRADVNGDSKIDNGDYADVRKIILNNLNR